MEHSQKVEEVLGRLKESDMEVEDLEIGSESEVSLLLFNVGGRKFAAGREFVRSVKKLGRVLWVPGAPKYFLGTMQYHGRMIAVLDLLELLGLKELTPTRSDYVVLFWRGETRISVAVDSVEGLINVPADSIESADNLDTKNRSVYTAGYFNYNGNVVTVLDFKKVFDEMER